MTWGYLWPDRYLKNTRTPSLSVEIEVAREVTPSFGSTRQRCEPTVRGLRCDRRPISVAEADGGQSLRRQRPRGALERPARGPRSPSARRAHGGAPISPCNSAAAHNWTRASVPPQPFPLQKGGFGGGRTAVASVLSGRRAQVVRFRVAGEQRAAVVRAFPRPHAVTGQRRGRSPARPGLHHERVAELGGEPAGRRVVDRTHPRAPPDSPRTRAFPQYRAAAQT